jgi:16S rRNA (guanine527-N7)-methyltransferase
VAGRTENAIDSRFGPPMTMLVRSYKGARKSGADLAPKTLKPNPCSFEYNPDRVNEDRISELLSPFLKRTALSTQQLSTVRTYIELLLKWNSTINLTAIRSPEEIVRRHFGESFFAASRILPNQNSDASLIDIGAGAGFPGLPAKILVPGIALTLIESNQRKGTFLREIVRALGLPNVRIEMSRAESLDIQAEVITLRAVEKFESILPIVQRLLKPEGRAALLIGASQVEVAQSTIPIDWQEPIPIPLSQSRVLLVGQAPLRPC